MNAMAHLPRRWSQSVTLWSQEVRATVTLAVPLVLIELAYMAIGLVLVQKYRQKH
jgi:hypothetical protein